MADHGKTSNRDSDWQGLDPLRCAASQPPGTSATQVYTGHETDTETGLIYTLASEPHGTACLTIIR